MKVSLKIFKQNIIYSLLFLVPIVFTSSCKKAEVPKAKGVFELNFQPVVGGQDFVRGEVYENMEGRKYMINLFLMYVSDISLIKSDGTEVLLSDIELFDIANGGSALRVSHGGNAYRTFDDVETGDYRGIKFGIGVADRLNTEPADYPVTHPLSVNKGMYWAWRTGYKFMSIEGMIDESPEKNGLEINKELAYHTGKDSINSPNVIYRQIEFTAPAHSFSIEADQELQYILELDINRIFNNVNMLEENITHSVPGDGFNLSTRITDNLVNEALYKIPF